MSVATVGAVLLAAGAAATLPRRVATERLKLPASHSVPDRHGAGPGVRASTVRTALLVAATATTLMLAVGRLGVGVAVGVTAILPVVLLSVRAARRRRTREANAAAVVELCDLLVAQLRAGRMPADAVRLAAVANPALFAPLVAAARDEAQLVDALRATPDRPGAAALVAVAAAWEVSASSGAPLAGVLGDVADAVRDELDVADQVRSELGTVRATARLLAGLPVFPLLLGVGLGADPGGFLFRSVAGTGCLLVGAGLISLGLWWVESIARAAELFQ